MLQCAETWGWLPAAFGQSTEIAAKSWQRPSDAGATGDTSEVGKPHSGRAQNHTGLERPNSCTFVLLLSLE